MTKLTLLTFNLIFEIDNPRDYKDKLLKLIRRFDTVAGLLLELYEMILY